VILSFRNESLYEINILDCSEGHYADCYLIIKPDSQEHSLEIGLSACEHNHR